MNANVNSIFLLSDYFRSSAGNNRLISELENCDDRRVSQLRGLKFSKIAEQLFHGC